MVWFKSCKEISQVVNYEISLGCQTHDIYTVIIQIQKCTDVYMSFKYLIFPLNSIKLLVSKLITKTTAVNYILLAVPIN